MTETHVLAFVNACLCAVCIFVFACRLNAMPPKKTGIEPSFWVVVEYAGGMAAMFVSALRPMWGEYPGYASLAVHAYIILHIVASASAWRGRDGRDFPPPAATRPADLI